MPAIVQVLSSGTFATLRAMPPHLEELAKFQEVRVLHNPSGTPMPHPWPAALGGAGDVRVREPAVLVGKTVQAVEDAMQCAIDREVSTRPAADGAEQATRSSGQSRRGGAASQGPKCTAKAQSRGRSTGTSSSRASIVAASADDATAATADVDDDDEEEEDCEDSSADEGGLPSDAEESDSSVGHDNDDDGDSEVNAEDDMVEADEVGDADICMNDDDDDVDDEDDDEEEEEDDDDDDDGNGEAGMCVKATRTHSVATPPRRSKRIRRATGRSRS